ncbi:protein-L-isoaspartate(D-aspartate) O-methyltransferase [Paraburkholderia eburnea]|uniref:Protein-L-isoaspartate O-methyltransferase n=1 Tax=Paraburkholderia eburnea TaxID=1189126 RepID=A0A2S4M4C5_9BURK|nr:protein-L-isoaspartate(D-aspartate) O-methyltransferase [Paraburkholderia eburnea]POR49495.1 protein-L-isoaspartate(D-aspartate) O-methyltransferase [Paraburkholderia eburnea]PRZ19875.1 protein-L-isoaspartate(D-aspartate) O-methyltransferase [Paraburkholderia eburnea]
MTGERTKRFPLGLADLVREPRRRDDARPGEARATPSAKPVAKVAVKVAVKGTANAQSPGARSSAIGSTANAHAVKAAKAPGVPHTAASPARKSASPRADLPGRAAQTFSPAATKPLPAGARNAQTRPVTVPRPGVTPGTGAPGVALNGALALTSERVRERMVERLRANGVTDPRVLQALAAVPRHMFVDPGLAAQAYEDAALPIGHHQTISKPSVVARMLELAGAGRELERVLEIGTGCGYQAAVLSRIARDVYSIERIKPLYERAKTNLRPLRIPNIRLHYGDGRLGMPSAAPFDAIVIAAAGFDVPQALLEQLAIGGRLVAPVAEQDEATQVLTLVERTGPAQWRESRLDRVFFVPLKSGVI